MNERLKLIVSAILFEKALWTVEGLYHSGQPTTPPMKHRHPSSNREGS
jgi:hypothetical protein